MKTKSFLFLMASIVFFIFVAAFLYFYLNQRSTLNSLVPNVLNTNKKPSQAEVLEAVGQERNPAPFDEKMQNEVEKALSQIKSSEGASTTVNTKMTDIEKALAADREREQNRDALTKALQAERN